MNSVQRASGGEMCAQRPLRTKVVEHSPEVVHEPHGNGSVQAPGEKQASNSSHTRALRTQGSVAVAARRARPVQAPIRRAYGDQQLHLCL